jgi:hypothetical protein
MYWDPTLVWRLEIRQGPSQSDPLIYEINNFVPCCSNSGPNPNDNAISTSTNQITNPQFAEVSFTNDLTITTAGTYPIAPGWNLILTGAGTTTLTQLVLSGSQNNINNPPFALKINNSGWTTSILQQTFNMNGGIWANGAIAGLLTGRAEITSEPITMNYVPSDAGTPVSIFTKTLTTGVFQSVGGAVTIGPSTDTDLSNVAFVNIQIVLPPTGIVDISNIQITGQDGLLAIDFVLPEYHQETIERNIDHQFNVFKDPLMRKPIPSYLVGWDFPFNPSQTGTVFSSAAGANTSFYTWDQTIIFQSVSNSMQTSRVTNGFLSVSASLAGQMAIIQYLPSQDAMELLDAPISAYLTAAALAPGPVPTSIPCTVSLWVTADASLPSANAGNSIVATLDANGKPATFHGNWTEIAPLNGQNAFFNLTTDEVALDSLWNNAMNNPLKQSATFFAIVIGFGTIPLANSIVVHSVGLQKGKIGTKPAPQTFDEVLRECQYYYEQSYEPGVAPGTVTNFGGHLNIQNFLINGGNIAAKPGIFELNYNVIKNTIPGISIYSPANGSGDAIQITLWNGGSVISTATVPFAANWQVVNSGLYRTTYQPASFTSLVNPAAVAAAPQSGIFYHYVLNSRLGA